MNEASEHGFRRNFVECWAAMTIALVLSIAFAQPARSAQETVDQIVFIVIDTLRADHLESYGHDRETSPELSKWFSSGRLYTRAFSTSSWTLPAMASLYTGRLPVRHGAGSIRPGRPSDEVELAARSDGTGLGVLDPGVATTAEVFSAAGFATGAVINNAFLAQDFGMARGFDDYDYDTRSNMVIRRADEVTKRALEWLDAHAQESVFLVAHYIDPHLDYDPPVHIRGRFTADVDSALEMPLSGGLKRLRAPGTVATAGDRQFVAAAYDEEILGVDKHVAALLSGLQERGLLGSGLVFLLSDHGEELFDHAGFEHGHAFWQELIRVPLAVWGRGVLPGRDESLVSIVDIAPTAYEAAGLRAETGAHARSLLSNLRTGEGIEARALYAQGNLYGTQRAVVIDWPHKLLFRRGTREPISLYDLARDPQETNNLLSEEGGIAKRLLDLSAKQLAEERPAPEGDRVVPALRPELLERLRALGYFEEP